jgi:hypothetical protein
MPAGKSSEGSPNPVRCGYIGAYARPEWGAARPSNRTFKVRYTLIRERASALLRLKRQSNDPMITALQGLLGGAEAGGGNPPDAEQNRLPVLAAD